MVVLLTFFGKSKPATSVKTNLSLPLVQANSGPARQRQVANTIAGLRVMNYYPAANAWTNMWTNWQPAVLNRDFARIHALGANAVRVVVFPNIFGWPDVSPTMAARFEEMLAIASSNNLGVQLTLFDFWDSYNEVAQSKIWLRSLLLPYAADPEIRLVELKNEVDPSDAKEIAWVRSLLPSLRSILPRTSITVSVSGTQGPSGFVRLRKELYETPLDVADLHFYGHEGSAYAWMLAAKRAAGSLPLFIGEIGYPAEHGPGGLAATEFYQAHWFDVVFAAARVAGVSIPSPWTLNDFQPGAIPWRAPPVQYDFGLYTATGQPLPAASVVKDAYKGLRSNTSNLSFDLAGDNRLPVVWSPYLPSQGILAYDPNVGYLRHGSVSLSKTRLSSLGMPSFYLVPVNPAIPGQLWTVNVWAKGIDVNGTAIIALAWFDSSGAFLGNSNSRALPHGNPDWTDLSVRARVPSDATSVQIHLKSFDVSGTVWFDDVHITVSPNYGP